MTTEAQTAMAPTSGKAASVRTLGILLGILGGVWLYDALARSQRGFLASEVGLGLGTRPFTAERDGHQISGPFEDQEALLETFRELKAAGRPVALWLGASQLYAINQPVEGDRIAVEYASDRAAGRGSDLAYVQSANPNANLTELLGSYLSFRQAGLEPDVLVLGFTYDDLKEPGVRRLIRDRLEPLPEEVLAATGEAGRHLAEALEAPEPGATEAAPIERTATAGTPQELLEDFLVEHIESEWEPYALRGNVRSAAITAWKIPVTTVLYKLFSRPTQRVPPELQTWNASALDAFVRLCAEDGVRLLVYQAPYRPDPHAFFHDRRAYDAFHAELEERLDEEGVGFRDLETLVPKEYWGTTNDGSPDVYHYRDEGHRRLGAAIDSWLEEEGY